MNPGQNFLRSCFPSWILPCFRDDSSQDVLKPTKFSETAPLHVFDIRHEPHPNSNGSFWCNISGFILGCCHFSVRFENINSDVKSNNSILQNCSPQRSWIILTTHHIIHIWWFRNPANQFFAPFIGFYTTSLVVLPNRIPNLAIKVGRFYPGCIWHRGPKLHAQKNKARESPSNLP